jgi:hypothetical protein
MNNQLEIVEALEVIKQAMIDDKPTHINSYANVWHRLIATSCSNAMTTEWESSADMIHIDCDKVANDAARRVMKLCFGVETTDESEPALIDWKADRWFAEFHHHNLNADFKLWWVSVRGAPDNCEEDTVKEYWIKCAFALMGWNERAKTLTGSADK